MPIISAKEKTNEAVQNISRFQSGEIKPVSTGNPWIDEVMLGGLLPSTILTIGGMSNHGKTHLLQSIENSILDTYDDIVMLRCNWESPVYKLLLRKMKEKTGAKLTELLYERPIGERLTTIKEICDQERRDGLYYMEEPSSPDGFFNEVSAFLEAHTNKKVLISIDHVGLVKGREKTSIDGLFEMMNLLKKMHPFVMFLPLIQMHRERILSRADDLLRHHPQQADFYGSDQLFQVSDGVIAIYNAYKVGIQEKYMKFTKNKFTYIDESFIIDGGEKWNHFDPAGNLFLHATKVRDMDDMEGIKEVLVENLFNVEKAHIVKRDTKKVDDLLDERM